VDRPDADPNKIATADWRAALEEAEGTVKRLALMWGMHEVTVRRHLRKHGLEWFHGHTTAANRAPKHVEPKMLDLRRFPTDKGPSWKHLIDWQDAQNQFDITQDTARVQLDVTSPIVVVFRGDWHLFGAKTDHRTFVRHQALLRHTPMVYTIENGDFHEGYIQTTKMGGVHEQVGRPKIQRHFLWDALEQLKGKVLCTTSGQHDHWGVHEADFDPIEWVSSDFRVPYLGHGGELSLTVGEVTYLIRVRHRGRGNSKDNPVHSIIVDWKENGATDICTHADKHIPAVLQVPYEGLMRIAARPGSYKKSDDWTKSHGFADAEPVMPGVVLFPDERRMLGFYEFEEAIEYLSRLRRPRRARRGVSEVSGLR